MADKTIEKTTDTDDTMQANKVNARDAGFTGKNNVVELDGYYTERKRINDSDTQHLKTITDSRGLPVIIDQRENTIIGKTAGDDLACAIEYLLEAIYDISVYDLETAMGEVVDAVSVICDTVRPGMDNEHPMEVATWLRVRWGAGHMDRP